MLAVALLVAHKLRAGWRGWAGLALIIALAGGAVLAAAAGAIRTDSAYPRFLASPTPRTCSSRPPGPATSATTPRSARWPAAAAAPIMGINAVPVAATGAPDNDAILVAPLDGRYGHTMDVPKLLSGRLPRRMLRGR